MMLDQNDKRNHRNIPFNETENWKCYKVGGLFVGFEFRKFQIKISQLKDLDTGCTYITFNRSFFGWFCF